MAFISEKEIENIRTNTNIVDIISGYIPLTQKGKNYFGVCPFHDDHSPSMSVSSTKQIYKCFSCGAVGNVFTFVKDIENVSFLEAVKIVAEKTISSTDDKNYIHRERRSYSKCERAFSLTDVDEDAIKDIFNNGILQINVPKLEKQETKKIVNID